MGLGMLVGVTFLVAAGWAQSGACVGGTLVAAMPGRAPKWALEAGGQNGAPGGGADGGEIEVLHVQGNVSMLAGAGGNITVQTG